MQRNDLEKNKFILQFGRVSIATSQELLGGDVPGGKHIEDMEMEKFEGSTIRTVTVF